MRNTEILNKLLILEAQADAIKSSAKELRAKLETSVSPVKKKDKELAMVLSKITENRNKVYNKTKTNI